jgi:hypothetical protein
MVVVLVWGVCGLCELGMLVWGAWLLVSGRTMRKGCKLTGAKARVRGLIILIAPVAIILTVVVSAEAIGVFESGRGALIELAIVIAGYVAQSLYSSRAFRDLEAGGSLLASWDEGGDRV